jgi:hypothetical protein
MESLQAFFERNGGDIHTLAQYIQASVDEGWEKVFAANEREMVEKYAEIGDSVYGIYGTKLFRPIHDQLKQVGLRSTPRLPFGGFSDSREWGEEDDRQRWFWSRITGADGAALGTIAVAFYHDHVQVHIPRAPKIYALEVTGKKAVIEGLSRLSPDFRDAQEARIEIAEYLASLERAGER